MTADLKAEFVALFDSMRPTEGMNGAKRWALTEMIRVRRDKLVDAFDGAALVSTNALAKLNAEITLLMLARSCW